MFQALCVAAALASATPQARVEAVVDAAVAPVMKKDGIPGMAVGAASTRPKRPVTRNTLFELGSVSKVFTATLASYAAVSGDLSLSANVDRYYPSLRGTAFGRLTLLNLGTHTTGGLPLQAPDGIETIDQLMAYFARWRPAHTPGTYRTYSNISIGMLGLIAAKNMHQDFTALLETRVFSALGLRVTFIDVPQNEMPNYAHGYTETGMPIRMAPDLLWAEAYGVRTTATDMIRFIEESMNVVAVNPALSRAIAGTHVGYFNAGPITQDLIWEQYRYPVGLDTLLAGNSYAMIFNATPAKQLIPPEDSPGDILLDKTGSTNGFGAYVAFVPARRIGVVILANKNYPIPDRVRLAYRILTRL